MLVVSSALCLLRVKLLILEDPNTGILSFWKWTHYFPDREAVDNNCCGCHPCWNFEGLHIETPRHMGWFWLSVQKSVASQSSATVKWRVPPNTEPSLEPHTVLLLLWRSLLHRTFRFPFYLPKTMVPPLGCLIRDVVAVLEVVNKECQFKEGFWRLLQGREGRGGELSF